MSYYAAIFPRIPWIPWNSEVVSDHAAEPGTDALAAGGVLWRTGAAGRTSVALVHRPRYDDWSFPKGKLNWGETAPVAAVRELAEETGFLARLGRRLGEVRYPALEGMKVVYYWSARAVSGVFHPNAEVDELRWLELDAADQLLSYQRDREVLDRFRRLEPEPQPLLLVRHAKAGDSQTWRGDDNLRPLTDKGQLEADQLVVLLSLFGPTTVYSAPPVRCVQTVQPLARRLGTPVRPEPPLSEDGYWRDPDAGLARLLELGREPGTAVVCSQGGVIPDVVNRLTGIAEPPARKASTWVLGFSGDRVVSSDYYPSPNQPD